jgi:LmbE family N-acetylglucosaminyl deacetylase
VLVEKWPAGSGTGGLIRLNLQANGTGPLHILCLGAHSDDIEIGCGGTVLRLAEQYPDCMFHWVVFSAIGIREAEAKHAATLFVRPEKLKDLLLKTFPDGFMPFVGAEVKLVFEELKKTSSPDIIFTHNRKDAHQDHRLIAELTWNTFRNHMVLEYEIPKYDGDMGQPNVFVPLERELCEKKVSHIMDAFHSQQTKPWFHPDTFHSLLRLRGMECNAPSGRAESFYCHKLVL